MNKDSKIYIAGHRGLVGSAIHRNLIKKGYKNIITKTHNELDLLNQTEVESFFKTEKPEFVFLAAAKVGGIMANSIYRGQFLYENLQIQNNIIHNSHLQNVKKLLFLGSSCIYPKNCPQPIKEDYLLTSELEYTNEPYAIAKIAGMKMCEAYNMQYDTNFISVMPTNLYGPGDNYDLEKSHVLPAMIRKMHLAKCLQNKNFEAIKMDLNNNPIENIDGQSSEKEIINILEKYGIINSSPVSLKLWGTGKPHREFLHSDDMADACVYIMENIDFNDTYTKFGGSSDNKEIKNTHINIGTGKDLLISELASLVKNTVEFTGNIIWDTDKPDGTFQKLLDVTKLHELGWKEKISLEKGVSDIYKDYVK
ncbi:MAG: GDP-L-fucose synthase [Bacteroidetes bacterium]|nr:MAG: GDP-L-fucose synthase [Bacteroidota bacterium]